MADISGNVPLFRVRGTLSEIQGFAAFVEDEAGFKPYFDARSAEPDRSGRDTMGQTELVDVMINFGVSVAGSASVEVVKALFGRYRRSRPHMSLDPVTETPASEQT